MIKKVKITDIHKKDMYYSRKDELVGQIFILDIDEDQMLSGWHSSKTAKDLMSMDKGNLSGHGFYAIKYEEVN